MVRVVEMVVFELRVGVRVRVWLVLGPVFWLGLRLRLCLGLG